MLGPYLERRLEEVLAKEPPIALVVEPDDDGTVSERRQQTALAVSRALGRREVVRYRPDGKPEVGGGISVSSSHGAGVTLAVTGTGPLGCDIQAVPRRPEREGARLLRAQAAL